MRNNNHASYLTRLFDKSQPALDLDTLATLSVASPKARDPKPLRTVTVVTVKRGRNAMRTIQVRS